MGVWHRCHVKGKQLNIYGILWDGSEINEPRLLGTTEIKFAFKTTKSHSLK